MTKRKVFYLSIFMSLILSGTLLGASVSMIETTSSDKNIVSEKKRVVKETEVKEEPEVVEEETIEEAVVTEPVVAAVEEVQTPTVQTPVQSDPTIIPYPHSDFKTYMYASAITNTASAQYQLLTKAYVGDYGIMTVDGCYLVAMGTAYAHYIGQKYQVTFETGQVINVMIGDVKQDIHTDQYNSAGINNGDLLEFIVSQPPQQVAIMGNYNVIFPGRVAYLIAI